MKSPSLMRISWWKSLHLTSAPPQRGATVTEGLRRRPLHKWSRPSGGRLKSRELCLTSTSNHSDPQVNPLCPPPPTNYILSSAYKPKSNPSCYRRPLKRTTSGLQTRNPWRTSRPTSLRSMTFKLTYSTKKTQWQAISAGWPSNDVFPSMAVIYKSATNQ